MLNDSFIFFIVLYLSVMSVSNHVYHAQFFTYFSKLLYLSVTSVICHAHHAQNLGESIDLQKFFQLQVMGGPKR